jgi:hypothetical protein
LTWTFSDDALRIADDSLWRFLFLKCNAMGLFSM